MNAAPGEVISNEVMVTPGRCVAWLCDEPAEGLACAEHAAEFERKPRRIRQPITTEAGQQSERDRKREYMRRKRHEQPGYCPGGNTRVKQHGECDKRRRLILALLTENGSVGTAELAAAFGISQDAAKRDLVALADQGLARRVYGGAVRPDLEPRGHRHLGHGIDRISSVA